MTQVVYTNICINSAGGEAEILSIMYLNCFADANEIIRLH